MADSGPAAPSPVEAPPFKRFLFYFLELGTLGFGGPIATVGYMQRDLVEERKWMSRQDLLDGIALGQTMPGPLAAQVAMWVGFLRRGAVGALATALAFIAPSFVIVVAIGFLYVRYQGLPAVQSLFYGISPAVIAIIALAAWKLARLTDGTDRRLWVVSAVVGVVTAVTGTEVALLFIAAGLLLLLWDAPPAWLPWRRAASLVGLPLQSVPALGAVASGSTLLALFLFFLKAGAFIFGSGLAIVPFLHQGVVLENHWLTERQFLDAVAVGLITPGPVVITAVFIGYLVGGLSGAIVSGIGIFLPIYLGVVIPGRWFIRHREDRRVRAFVKGATAAAAGAIAGATVLLARGAILDIPTALIAVVSLAYLWRLKFRLKEPALVFATGAIGLLIHGA
ncbi:MAG TPA: chromate efflux transporter [Candidatus Eisenbacteria bacterium]|nr:chromate efflux transporter [Candidatus Eisenbacteria bacterium]